MFNDSTPIEKLHDVFHARQAITQLLQTIEKANDTGMLVEFHKLGHLLSMLEEIESEALMDVEQQLVKLNRKIA